VGDCGLVFAHGQHSEWDSLVTRWTRCRTNWNAMTAMPSMGVAEVVMSKNITERAREKRERERERERQESERRNGIEERERG
jgi:hypothetical protein